jgi:uncharacterized membrane protein
MSKLSESVVESAYTAVSRDAKHEQIEESIAAVHDFYTQEEARRSASQRYAETLSNFVGRPAILIFSVVFVVLWLAANYGLHALNHKPFDEAPFHWLQGIIALAALLTTVAVLIKQTRIEKVSEQRDHLDLNISLLIEQKTAKLIHLLEELRRDLPNVKDRHDSGAIMMQTAMSPERVLAALNEELISQDGSVSTSTAPSAAADASQAPAAPSSIQI